MTQQLYDKVNAYDFIPVENMHFKDPKDFTNVLFKRMSYHYVDNNNQNHDFVMAKMIPSQLRPLNHTLNLQYAPILQQQQQQQLLQQQQQHTLLPKSSLDASSSSSQHQNYTQLQSLQLTQEHLLKLPNPQDTLAQYEYVLRNPAHLGYYYPSNGNNNNSENQSEQLSQSIRESYGENNNNNTNDPIRFNSSSRNSRASSQYNNKIVSLQKVIVGSSQESNNNNNTVNINQSPQLQAHSFQRSTNSSNSRRKEQSEGFQQNAMIKQTQQSIDIHKSANISKDSKILSKTAKQSNNARAMSSGCHRRNISVISEKQKSQFHEVCQKLNRITCFSDYAQLSINNNQQKQQQETNNTTPVNAQNSQRIESLNVQSQAMNTSRMNAAWINKRNVQELKMEQQNQLVRMAEFERTNEQEQALLDQSIFDEENNHSMVKSVNKKMDQTVMGSTMSPGLARDIQNDWSFRVRRLQTDVLRRKAQQQNNNNHEKINRFDVSAYLLRKNKLYGYLEEEEDEMVAVKPKKCLKLATIQFKEKDKSSMKEGIIDGKNKINTNSSSSKFSLFKEKKSNFPNKSLLRKFRSYKALLERIKQLPENQDLVDNKVFTAKAYQRPGSYIFLKMVRMNKIEQVKSQLEECPWRVFDFDHMTALHVAINKGLKDMAFLLIDMGADLEAEDIDNKPPLWHSLKNNQFEIAKYLLLNRASPWANDNFKYYEMIDDPDMRSSLRVSRQLYFTMRTLPWQQRAVYWSQNKDRIIDPIFNQE